jgi:hypothetical protein
MTRIKRFYLTVDGTFKGYWPLDDRPLTGKSDKIRDAAMSILIDQMEVAFGPFQSLEINHVNNTLDYRPKTDKTFLENRDNPISVIL